jgi:hypothetical protein
LNEFVEAYQGNVNNDFWQRICTYIPLGSGGSQNFRGWFMVFSPFSKEGEYLLRSYHKIKADNIYCHVVDTEVPDCHIEAEILMEDYNGRHNLTLFGGLLMTNYDSDTNILSPTRDYAIIKAAFVDERMLEEIFALCLSKSYKYAEMEKKNPGFFKEFYKFLCFICAELNVPNNVLLKITRDYAGQILWYKEAVSEKSLTEIYEYLSQDYYGLHEFFPQNKKDELIKTFLQQHRQI